VEIYEFSQVKPGIIIKTLRYVFIALLSIAHLFTANAQAKFATAVSSNEIGRNDYLQIQFIISNAKQIDQFSAPSFPDFQIVEGPSQSTGMTNINGNVSQYQSIAFLIQPSKTGKFTLSGATATIDGKQMHSNSVSVTVTPGSSGGGSPHINNNLVQPFFRPQWPGEPEEDNKEYVLKAGENVSDVIRKNLFVRVQVSKNKCYVGEPIVATYKLYSCLRSESRVTKLPSMNGFSVYDMVDPNKNAPSYETVNGKKFTVHIIRKTQLIPLQSGTVELDPVQIENDVYFLKGGSRRHHTNILDDFFDNFSNEEGGNMVEQHITLNSKPVSITVNALPEKNKPANFSGAVGSFNVNASIENKTIAARDEATLKITVKGKGNLPIINAPQIAWPPSIEGNDPTAKENVDKSVAPMAGEKTFEYIFSPKNQGDHSIPPIEFSYFDPSTNNYRTIKTEAMDFYAAAENKKTRSPNAEPPAEQKPENGNAFKSFVEDHLEWFFAAIILCSLAAYFFSQNRKISQKEKEKEEALRQEKEKAFIQATEAIDPLLRAKAFLSYSDYKGFYEELNRAVWTVLREKLQIRSSELNKQNVIKQLQIQGWDPYEIMHLETILNKCDMNLYTPDYNESNSQQFLLETEGLLNKLRLKKA
jgi:hypothetical protein